NFSLKFIVCLQNFTNSFYIIGPKKMSQYISLHILFFSVNHLLYTLSSHLFNINKQNRNVRWRYAGYSGRLSNRMRANVIKLLNRFFSEIMNILIYNIIRYQLIFHFFELLHLLHLSGNVSLILKINVYLFYNRSIKR